MGLYTECGRAYGALFMAYVAAASSELACDLPKVSSRLRVLYSAASPSVVRIDPEYTAAQSISNPNVQDTVILRLTATVLRSFGTIPSLIQRRGEVSGEPQETVKVLRYVHRLGRVAEVDPQLIAYLQSPDAIYPHQHYEILSWRLDQVPAPVPRFVAFVRYLLAERTPPPYLRTICREFLARYGSPGDLDGLHDTLLTTTSDMERAELVCCLRRMEPARRNGILNRYTNAGLYTDRALALVRGNLLPGA